MNNDTTAKIAKLKAEIEQNDDEIEKYEYHQSLRRQHGDRLYNRLVLLEAQLAREEAPLVRPQPERVDVEGWSI